MHFFITSELNQLLRHINNLLKENSKAAVFVYKIDSRLLDS